MHAVHSAFALLFLGGLITTGCNLSAPVFNNSIGFDETRDLREQDMVSDTSQDMQRDAVLDLAIDVPSDAFNDVSPDDASQDSVQDVVPDEVEDVPPDVPPPAPVCSDGAINQVNEECDDGNATSGDGCSSACLVEPGYVCSISGQPCVLACGDGIKDLAEECDDGDASSGDGCSATCLIEDEFICPTPGASCKRPTVWTWDTSAQRVPAFPMQTTGTLVSAECAPDEFLMQIVPRVLSGRMVRVILYCSALEAPLIGQNRLLNVSPNGNGAYQLGLLPLGSGFGLSADRDGHLVSFGVHLDANSVVVGLEIVEASPEVVGGGIKRISSSSMMKSYGTTLGTASNYTSACASDELPYGLTGYLVNNGASNGFIHRFNVMCTKVLMN